MQVVIDINEDEFCAIKNGYNEFSVFDLIANVRFGTPLPKGHGRLIDENNLIKEIEDGIVDNYFDMKDWVLDSPTIVELDSSTQIPYSTDEDAYNAFAKRKVKELCN